MADTTKKLNQGLGFCHKEAGRAQKLIKQGNALAKAGKTTAGKRKVGQAVNILKRVEKAAGNMQKKVQGK